jgi:hypothetical protein
MSLRDLDLVHLLTLGQWFLAGVTVSPARVPKRQVAVVGEMLLTGVLAAGNIL